jgi:hypothetical protein
VVQKSQTDFTVHGDELMSRLNQGADIQQVALEFHERHILDPQRAITLIMFVIKD